MCKATFSETLKKVDISDVFERNGSIIKLDGLEDHLVSNTLKVLVWGKINEFRSQLLNWPNPNTLKTLEEVMITKDGVKRKLLDEVINSIPPDKGSEIYDEEYTDDEWDDNENKYQNESKY